MKFILTNIYGCVKQYDSHVRKLAEVSKPGLYLHEIVTLGTSNVAPGESRPRGFFGFTEYFAYALRVCDGETS